MNGFAPNAMVLRQLEQSLCSDALTPAASEQGRHLLERLNSPVRTVILGLPGSGKSQIFNLLAGKAVLSGRASLPSVELTFAEKSQTVFTLKNGETKTTDGIMPQDAENLGATFVSLEASLPVLAQTSLLDVFVGSDAEDQQAKIDWAIKRADIVLWCSQEFTAEERKIWSAVPDAMKDHSFFVLTKADSFSSKDALAARISALEDVVAEEFHSLVPVATLQANAAIATDCGVDEDLLSASGGKALIDVVLRQVELGRRADMDSVVLFLSRHKIVTGTPGVKPEDLGIGAATALNLTPVQSQAAKDAVCGALEYLHQRATDLLPVADLADPDHATAILEHCSDTANNLAELITSKSSQVPDYMQLQDDIAEVSELLLLMRLEDGQGPAADAVTLLLQLRRDLELKLAA